MQQNQDYQVLPKKFFSNNKHLALMGLTNYHFISHSHLPWKRYVERVIRWKEERFLFETIRHGSFDIYHPTYYNPPYLKYLPKDKPLVVLAHGAKLLFPKLNRVTFYLNLMVWLFSLY